MIIWNFNEYDEQKLKLLNLKNCINFFKEPFELSLIEEVFYNYMGVYCMKSLKLRYTNSGPEFLEMQAKCLVEDFLLLLYLLNGKNVGSWGDDDFKTEVILKVNGNILNVDGMNFEGVLILVDNYGRGGVVECWAKQKIIRPDQFGIVHALVLHLYENGYDLYDEEFRREVLVFEGKIKDVDW